jgi:hypothetical protein
MTLLQLPSGSVPAPAQTPRQEALLRLLDTRIACLMVDRPATEVLRRDLLRLRDRLARQRLDTASLRQVETLLAELRAPAPGGSAVPAGARSWRGRWSRRPSLPGRTASRLAGLSGTALLLASLPL